MLVLHQLGDVDLLDLSNYMTNAEDDHGENPKLDMIISGYALGDGARVTRRRITDLEREFYVIAIGDTYDASEANLDLIDDELLIAFNNQSTSTPTLYQEQDESQGSPENWKVLGGVLVRDYRWRSAGLAAGMLTIHRSKA